MVYLRGYSGQSNRKFSDQLPVLRVCSGDGFWCRIEHGFCVKIRFYSAYPSFGWEIHGVVHSDLCRGYEIRDAKKKVTGHFFDTESAQIPRQTAKIFQKLRQKVRILEAVSALFFHAEIFSVKKQLSEHTLSWQHLWESCTSGCAVCHKVFPEREDRKGEITYTLFTPKSWVGPDFKPHSHCISTWVVPIYTEPESALLFPMDIIKKWLFEGPNDIICQRPRKCLSALPGLHPLTLPHDPGPTHVQPWSISRLDCRLVDPSYFVRETSTLRPNPGRPGNDKGYLFGVKAV